MRRRWDVIDVTFAGFVVAFVLLLIREVGATGPKIVVKPPCPKYEPVPVAQPTTDEQVLEWIRAEQWRRAMADLVERIKSVGGL